MRALKHMPMLFTAFGASLPVATKDHRGQLVWKRASGAEDEINAGVVDSSGVAQFRRLVTTTLGATIYALRKSTATNWTSAVGAAMGTSPGAITQAGAEYTGRIIADTGGSGTTTGILFTITFANARASSNYNIFLNAQNANSAAVNAYAINDSNTQFTIRCQVAPGFGQEMRFGWLIEDRTP